jgi:hypothetical protein
MGRQLSNCQQENVNSGVTSYAPSETIVGETMQMLTQDNGFWILKNRSLM